MGEGLRDFALFTKQEVPLWQFPTQAKKFACCPRKSTNRKTAHRSGFSVGLLRGQESHLESQGYAYHYGFRHESPSYFVVWTMPSSAFGGRSPSSLYTCTNFVHRRWYKIECPSVALAEEDWSPCAKALAGRSILYSPLANKISDWLGVTSV